MAQPTEIVHIDGQVKVPGDYPLEPGMRVSDLIRAGGGLDPGGLRRARGAVALHGREWRAARHAGDLDRSGCDASRRSRAPTCRCKPFDRLSIKQISGWTEQDQVTLKGEVRFPGTYTIQPGETLHSVIERAGGLTAFAFVEGSVFTRTELKEREQEQLDRLAERLRTEIAEVALMGVRGTAGRGAVGDQRWRDAAAPADGRQGRRPTGDQPAGGARTQAGLERRRHSAQWR